MNTSFGFLLRKTKLTETSLIITWLTADHGKIKTAAKGARRAKSTFAGKLDLFFQAEIQWIPNHRSEIQTLKEIALIQVFEKFRTDHRRFQLAALFAEWIDMVTENEHPVPELYDLLQRAFHYLNLNAANKKALLHFELELVKLLGIQNRQPAFETLGHTYGKIPAYRETLFISLPETAVPKPPTEP